MLHLSVLSEGTYIYIFFKSVSTAWHSGDLAKIIGNPNDKSIIAKSRRERSQIGENSRLGGRRRRGDSRSTLALSSLLLRDGTRRSYILVFNQQLAWHEFLICEDPFSRATAES